MQIKAVFPEADAAKVFLEQPYYFLATNLHTMEGSVARLQSILPEVHIDRYAQTPLRTSFMSSIYSSLTWRNPLQEKFFQCQLSARRQERGLSHASILDAYMASAG